MEAKVQEFLTFHGLQLCPGHGICYESRTGYCHLVSSTASEQDIGDSVDGYIRRRCQRKGIQCRWPCIKELGQYVSRLMDDRLSSAATESWCFVSSRKKLLYFCGCKNTQPMLKGNFERHIHAEGNRNKCRWSLWGKSDTEKLVMEATAVACCRVRCVKATCGLWIIRDRIEPDMSKLSKIIQKLIARRVDRGNQQSDLGDESTLAVSNDSSSTSGVVDEGENSSDSQPALEVEESAADTEAPIAPAESRSTSLATMNSNIAQSTKPVILLLGYTFRRETNDNGPTYEELLEEARHFYGKDSTQLPGAIRDKARIVRLLDRGFDCFCVSKSNKDENDESMHYYGDFCDRKFVQELRETLNKYGKPHPVQICVDWVYCPIGWDTTHYLKPQFFTKTLPEIASVLSSDIIEIDAKNRRITRKRKRDEKIIPSGVIFLPFTLGVVTELFKVLDLVEESYTISYLDREQLMVEHPMYAATESIPDDEMKLLNKKPRPENGYAEDLFKNIDVGASSNVNARLFKGYVQSNCTEQTRMIKLTLKQKEMV